VRGAGGRMVEGFWLARSVRTLPKTPIYLVAGARARRALARRETARGHRRSASSARAFAAAAPAASLLALALPIVLGRLRGYAHALRTRRGCSWRRCALGLQVRRQQDIHAPRWERRYFTECASSCHGMRIEPRERTIVMHAHSASRSKPSILSGAVADDPAMSPKNGPLLIEVASLGLNLREIGEGGKTSFTPRAPPHSGMWTSIGCLSCRARRALTATSRATACSTLPA